METIQLAFAETWTLNLACYIRVDFYGFIWRDYVE